MEKVLIAGGSGFIGRHLTARLQEAGYAVGWMSRSAGKQKDVQVFQWDVLRQRIDPAAIEWADHIIVLSGAGIADKRWTEKRKKEIIFSRVQSAQLLIYQLQQQSHSVQTVTAASAVGYYGNRGDEWLDETAAPGVGFLTESTQAWEDASIGFNLAGIEPAIIRIGLVLGRESGLLKEMDKQLRWGIRPIVGNGRQFYPWIHVDDVAGIFMHAMQQKLQGVYNAVAPQPLTQNALLKAIVRARGTLALPAPAPAFVLHLMLGEMANAVLGGQRVKADEVMRSGYSFRFEDADSALADLYKK